jgi:hypothetical protein
MPNPRELYNRNGIIIDQNEASPDCHDLWVGERNS